MSAAEHRITSDNVLRHLHSDPLPGTTVRATRFWLSLGLAALAGRLGTTTAHLEAVKAGEQTLTADQHQHLTDMATAALAGMLLVTVKPSLALSPDVIGDGAEHSERCS